MELFIEAYDWVMFPNVYGMGLFVDAGLMATKPYLSFSNYILKMSDYPKGKWAEIWNGLYWRFCCEIPLNDPENPPNVDDGLHPRQDVPREVRCP